MGKRQRSPENSEHCRCDAAEGRQVDSTASKKDEASAVSVADDRGMDEAGDGRIPLSEAVADCVNRWFADALQEAATGDVSMQVLVGQMYRVGYGVAKSDETANAWFTKASRYRASVWRVSDKRPGYHASDSDSDEEKDDLRH